VCIGATFASHDPRALLFRPLLAVIRGKNLSLFLPAGPLSLDPFDYLPTCQTRTAWTVARAARSSIVRGLKKSASTTRRRATGYNGIRGSDRGAFRWKVGGGKSSAPWSEGRS